MKRGTITVSFIILLITLTGCSTNENQIKNVLKKYEKAQNSKGEVGRIEASKPYIEEHLITFMQEEYSVSNSIYKGADTYKLIDYTECIYTLGKIDINNEIAQAEIFLTYKPKDLEPGAKLFKAISSIEPQTYKVLLRKNNGKWLITNLNIDTDMSICQKANSATMTYLWTMANIFQCSTP